MNAAWRVGRKGGAPRGRRSAVLRVRAAERELARTKRLWEIGKLLTDFDGIEATVPRAMAVLGAIVPLHAAILMVDDGPSARDVTWHDAGMGPHRLRAATARARTGYRYLVAQATSRVPDAPADDGRRSILLPLVVHRGKIFGTLHLDCAAATSEADLALVSAVVGQLAVAIARQRAIDSSQRSAFEAVRCRQEALETVSHDLKNPLGAIAMNGDLLAVSEGEGWRRRAIESIQRSARKMTRLIDDLLDAVSIEAGTLSIERARHGAAELITDAFESQRPAAVARGLRLRYGVPDEPVDILCDPGRVHQVLVNLVANAIKFTPAGREITLLARRRGPEVEFSVADEGHGIPESDQSHVFERYWQGRRSVGVGSGLGLAIAHDLVKAHGGRIWVESEVDVGTTFVFTVPIAP